MAQPSPTAPQDTSARLLGLAPAIFVVLWATGFIGARLGLPDSEPFTFLLLRFLIAGAILLAVAFAMGAPWPRGKRAVVVSILAGALIQGGYLGGVFWAIDNGLPAGVAALIVAVQPPLTAVLAAPLLGERITRAHWLGLAIGFAGLVLVLGPRLEMTGAGITPLTVGSVLLATLSIVLGSIGQKAYAGATDLRTGTFLQYVGGALVVGLGAILFESFDVRWTPAFTFAMAWLVLVLSLGAVLLYLLLLRHGAVARISTLFFLVPPVTALIAWAMFGETLSLIQLVGMAVTVGGVALATRRA